MSGFDNKKSGKSILKRLGLILTLPFIVFIISYGVYKLFFMPPPLIEGMDAFKTLPKNKIITLDTKNLRSINIFISQGGKKIELLRDVTEDNEKRYAIEVKPGELKLRDGAATVIIQAKSGITKEVEYKINSVIDTVPPTLGVARSPYMVTTGAGGFVALKSRGADSVFVKFGEYMFRGFKADTESDSDFAASQELAQQTATTYYVFFPVPFDVENNKVFYAVAKDNAGNQSVRALPIKLKMKKYKTSSINIDDSFINKVVAPLLNKTDISDPVSAFKEVNEKRREEGLKKLIEIAGKTEPEIFWEGRFLQLKNSKVMAKYGDKRTYFYKGKMISKSAHLGYDLASTPNAPVEAANTGVVKFAGDLGIYGNTVAIDHGLGLMSLYGHLSTIMVKEGEAVKKGAVIGQTGATGLAGGDHLHFGILIHGYEVSPLYWWDLHWVKVNVLDYIGQ